MKTATLEPAADSSPAAARGGKMTLPDAHTVHIRNILVPLDFSERSLGALRYAIHFAQLHGAKLTLLHVLKPPLCVSDYPYPGPQGQDGFEVLEKMLDDIRRTKIPPGLETEIMVRRSFTFGNILEVFHDIQADLIVITTHGRTGLNRLLRRSIAGAIMRHASCPVLVVPCR